MTLVLTTPGIQSAEIAPAFSASQPDPIAPVLLEHFSSLVGWIAQAARLEAMLLVKTNEPEFAPGTSVIRFVRSGSRTLEELPADIACTHAIQAMKAESLFELDTRGLGPQVRAAMLRPFTNTIEPYGAQPERSFGELLSHCRNFSQVCAHAFQRRCPDEILDVPNFGALRIEAASKRVQSVLNRWLFSEAPPEETEMEAQPSWGSASYR